MSIGTRRRLTLWAALLLALMAGRSHAESPPDRVIPSNIHFLGWDPSGERFYYIVDSKTYSTLKCYDASDSTDQQPHRLGDSIRPGGKEFRKQIEQLRARLQPVEIIDSADSARVSIVNRRAHHGDDYVDTIADFRITFRAYTGAWTSYFSCGPGAPLRVPGIVLAPNGRDGLAVMRNLTANPQCRFTLLMLISTRPVAFLRQDWNQGP